MKWTEILTQLYISFDDLENGLREAYTKPFKIRTVGRHPVLVTFQSYGGLVKCVSDQNYTSFEERILIIEHTLPIFDRHLIKSLSNSI